jgi:hypothetical protein
MKFQLKEDWLYESEFLGQKITKKLYDKGHIFEPINDKYEIIHHTGEVLYLSDLDMNKIDILEEIKENDLEIIIEEIPDDDDNLVRNWRIQLDVKTTRKKLKEFEKKFKENVKYLE